MGTIRWRMRLDADPARLWDQMFDYDAPPPDFAKGQRVEIVEPGDPDPKGLGCVRALHGGKGEPTVERIVGWDPPHSFSYSIMSSPMPVKSYEGRMQLTADGEATIIDYVAEFEPKMPGTGFVVRGFFALMSATFIKKYFRWLATEACKRPRS